MGLFDFLKGKKTGANKAEEIIERVALNAKTSSVVKLFDTIFKSSMKLADTTKNEMSELWKSKNISIVEEKTIWFTMLAEFIYCHLAITDRIAFSVLGKQRRNDLMNELVSTIRFSAVESVFNEWDEKLKDNFKKHFSDGYTESQERYSKGKELIDKKEPFTGNGVFSILGREIAEINNCSTNPEINMRTIELTATSFSQMNLNKFVEDFKNSQ